MKLWPWLVPGVMRGSKPYWKTILNTQPANLIGLWRLNETTGTIAVDSSPEGNDGAYTGVDLANAAGPDGVLVPFFDGTNDYVNIYSAAFNTDFDPAELTILVWAKVFNVGVWTDGVARKVAYLANASTSSRVLIARTGANQMAWSYVVEGTTDEVVIGSLSLTSWMQLAITISVTADEMKSYLNGSQVGTTQTGLGTWSGGLASTRTLISGRLTTPLDVWHGWIGPAAIWNKALTPTEIAALFF